MSKKLSPIHGFRVGDVVKRKDGKDGLFVVSGTKGWIHSTWRNDDGTIDSWVSLAKEIGSTSLLTPASEYKPVTPREKVGKKWWAIFPKGEK